MSGFLLDSGYLLDGLVNRHYILASNQVIDPDSLVLKEYSNKIALGADLEAGGYGVLLDHLQEVSLYLGPVLGAGGQVEGLWVPDLHECPLVDGDAKVVVPVHFYEFDGMLMEV